MASKKKQPKKIIRKVTKKATKKTGKKLKSSACLMDNHTGKPQWNKWIGYKFNWREPWEDDEGNHFRLDGEWEITSLSDDCETCWVAWVPNGEYEGDYEMEFPLSMVEGFDPKA